MGCSREDSAAQLRRGLDFGKYPALNWHKG